MPSATAQAQLDDLARQTDSPPVEIETGCGFCLYIKRSALDQVGYLDEVHLARGYGEETDWCLRARSLGWRHMGAANVFVAHQGGISFGAEKTLRVAHNNAILRKRYPDASARYNAFCLRDPIKPAREQLQRARVANLAGLSTTAQRAFWSEQTAKTLHISGGDAHSESVFSLAWRHEHHRVWATLQAPMRPLSLSLEFELPGQYEQLLETLRLLPVCEIQYEQLSRCPTELCELPSLLGLPYRIVCRDDRLLSQDATFDWQRFARAATAIQLPWRALQAGYASGVPEAALLPPTHTPASVANPVSDATLLQVLLIGDSLNRPTLAQRWLSLARQAIREQLPLILLAKDDGPWLKALQATGIVHRLPLLHDFSLAERARAAGCGAVLSLDDAPGADWNAPMLAETMAVPLLANPSAVATEAGASALTSLPFSVSQA